MAVNDMKLDANGKDPDGRTYEKLPGDDIVSEYVKNFISCVMSVDTEKLTTDKERSEEFSNMMMNSADNKYMEELSFRNSIERKFDLILESIKILNIKLNK
jgi:hypothetical protein